MPSNLSEYLISTLDSEQMEGEGRGLRGEEAGPEGPKGGGRLNLTCENY